MPYLVASQFAGLLPAVGTITGSSQPLTIDEVATVIAQVSAELDGAAAAAGYAVPVAPPASGGASTAYSQMEALAEYGAGWRVMRSFFPNQGGPADRSSLAAEYRDAYRQALLDLRTGNLILVGATIDSSGASRQLPRSNYTSNVGEEFHTATPVFDMDSMF